VKAVYDCQPWQRTDSRIGYANGFKDKTVMTKLGNLLLNVPQVRGDVEFYPSALEKGIRSEKALKLAISYRAFLALWQSGSEQKICSLFLGIKNESQLGQGMGSITPSMKTIVEYEVELYGRN
jgi:hypothetical protein